MLNVFSKIYGTRNDREVKQYRKKAQEITSLENKYENLSDEELQNEYWQNINPHFSCLSNRYPIFHQSP